MSNVKTKANPDIGTKPKQAPLLKEESASLYNTLNRMSQEQLRKYVSTFNKEARIVGGHAMKKDQLIKAIIEKAKVVESLLKKLRVDVPKMPLGTDKAFVIQKGPSKGKTTTQVRDEANKTKARATEPKKLNVGETTTRYEPAKIDGKRENVYFPGYAIKGNVDKNRFPTYSQARQACNKTGTCNAITKEQIAGKVYYSMRSGTTAKKGRPARANEMPEISWKKVKKVPLIKKVPKK